MDAVALNALVAGVDFGDVTTTMFAIGTGVLLIHGAWKAYKFVSRAVKGA